MHQKVCILLEVTTGPKAALGSQWTKHLQYSTEVSTPAMRGDKNKQTNPKKQATNRQYRIICRKYRNKRQRCKTPALPIPRHAAGTGTVGTLMIMGEEGKDSLAGFCPNIYKGCNNMFSSTRKGRNNSNAYRLPKTQATGIQREAAWKIKEL